MEQPVVNSVANPTAFKFGDDFEVCVGDTIKVYFDHVDLELVIRTCNEDTIFGTTSLGPVVVSTDAINAIILIKKATT